MCRPPAITQFHAKCAAPAAYRLRVTSRIRAEEKARDDYGENGFGVGPRVGNVQEPNTTLVTMSAIFHPAALLNRQRRSRE